MSARHRLLAGIVGLSVLLGVGLAPHVPQTEAAWTDAEFGTGTVTAINIPEPISSKSPGCVASTALGLDPKVTINWRVPVGVTGYSLTNAEFGQIPVGGGPIVPLAPGTAGIATTGTIDAYVTQITGGLLGGLLGATMSFGIRFTGPGGWKSNWLLANATIGLLGANPQCSMSTLPSS